MKKILCLALCFMFCLSALVGCGGLEEGEKGANVRMYLSDYPYTLDPAVVQLNSDVEQILSLIFEPLTTIDEDGDVQPALATEWYYKYDEIYQLHKMYFKLKETAWSDNRPVTADDVIYAWSRILSPEMDSPYASLLYGIKGARNVKSGIGTIDDLGLAAVDNTLLEVTFEKEYDCDLFAEQVANVHLAPAREDIITRCAKNGDDWAASATDMVANGKFRVQTMDMPREKKEGEQDFSGKFACKLVLERNAYYMRNPEKDDLDEYVDPYRITCLYYEGQTEYYPEEKGLTQQQFQANRFDNGEVFYLGKFDKETFKKYQDDIETQQTLNGFAFYFNTEKEFLSDANVRKALSAALDRKAITEATGTGEVPATGYVPTGVFNTDRKSDFREAGGNLYNVNADVEKAKSLLGGKKGTIKVAYLVPLNEFTVNSYSRKVNYVNVYEEAAKKAAENWKAIGINAELVGLNPEAYLTALKTSDFDVIGVNIVNGSVDAFSYLAPFAKEFSGSGIVVDNSVATTEETFNPHYTKIDNADYSNLIQSAVSEKDRAKRAEILHNAEKKLVEELCPATMVFFYSRSFVASDEIDGYETDSWFGYIDLTELELDDWREINSKEEELNNQRNTNK